MINPQLDKKRIDKLLEIRKLVKEYVIKNIDFFSSIREVPEYMINLQTEDLSITQFRHENGHWWFYGVIYGERFMANPSILLFPNRMRINHGIAYYEIAIKEIRFCDGGWNPLVSDINYEYNLNLPDDYFNWSDDDILMFRMCV